MTNYLDRMMLRVNGQLPVIKPILRSSYDMPLLINETKTEFEESVSFEASDTLAVPGLSSKGFQSPSGPIVRPVNNTFQGEDGSRTVDLDSGPVQDRAGQVLTPPDFSSARDPASMESPVQSSGIFQTGSINMVFKKQNIRPLEEPGQTQAPIKADYFLKMTDKPSIISGEKPTEYQLNRSMRERSVPEGPSSKVSEVNPQMKRAEQQPNIRTVSSGKTDGVLPEIEVHSGQQPHNLIKGFGSSGLENAAASRLVKQRFQPETVLRRPNGELTESAADTSNPPTNNITVTIGRIEIKAVNLSHPPVMPVQARSKPKEPAVTLESYLKSRGEVRR